MVFALPVTTMPLSFGRARRPVDDVPRYRSSRVLPLEDTLTPADPDDSNDPLVKFWTPRPRSVEPLDPDASTRPSAAPALMPVISIPGSPAAGGANPLVVWYFTCVVPSITTGFVMFGSAEVSTIVCVPLAAIAKAMLVRPSARFDTCSASRSEQSPSQIPSS